MSAKIVPYQTMKNWLKVFSGIVLQLAMATVYPTAGEGDEEKYTIRHLTIASIEKPPYTTSVSNGSFDNIATSGLVRDAIWGYLTKECGRDLRIEYKLNSSKFESEFAMIESLRQNQVHIVAPVFEPGNNRKYSEFPFFKLDDYPGTEYITIEEETNALHVVLEAVKKSWPLFAVTLVLTAIAGVIMWALDTYWNNEEFPRSFIRGSWDGFWWSFVSMTTVGYGDKTPKSVVARIFSIIWIQLGLVIMAIFMAHITSALTALSLEPGPGSLIGKKVAVLDNGTAYQQAVGEDASPIVYEKIEDIIDALKAKQVHGMFLDRYTASYYQSREKLKSLIPLKKFELHREVGILISKERKDLADCLNIHRSSIWRLVQTITATFKLTQQKPVKDINLFDESSVKGYLFPSLGVLGGLLFFGAVWEIFIRTTVKIKQKVTLIGLKSMSGRISTDTDVTSNDLEIARTLLRQLQEHFDKMEEKFKRSRTPLNDAHEVSNRA